MLIEDEGNKSLAYGALFTIDASEQCLLDRAEGRGNGYFKQLVQCRVGGQAYSAFTYLARPKFIDASLKPYHWYKELVLSGARYHQFPEDYIASLEDSESIQDPDTRRRTANEQLLNEIKLF